MADIKQTIIDDFDHVIDEKGSTFIALRKIVWEDTDPSLVDPNKVKLDIRKYYTAADGKETVSKGVSFITEQGPHNLTTVLVDNGYGDTKDILTSIKNREDFRPSLNSVLGKDDEHYDPNIKEDKDLYVPDDDLFNY